MYKPSNYTQTLYKPKINLQESVLKENEEKWYIDTGRIDGLVCLLVIRLVKKKPYELGFNQIDFL